MRIEENKDLQYFFLHDSDVFYLQKNLRCKKLSCQKSNKTIFFKGVKRLVCRYLIIFHRKDTITLQAMNDEDTNNWLEIMGGKESVSTDFYL